MEMTIPGEESFGVRLCRLMRCRGYTVRWTANQAGMSESTLQDWRGGVMPRDIRLIKKLSDVLGVGFEDLCFGEKGEAGE